jgi:hypothetical protein
MMAYDSGWKCPRIRQMHLVPLELMVAGEVLEDFRIMQTDGARYLTAA